MTITCGIDALSFYVPNYYLPLATLACARGVAKEKFVSDLGQEKMAVSPPDEDVVTLAANAAERVLQYCDISDIDMLLFATESGNDCSKAAGMYLHKLLALSSTCRIVELKQACYAATCGLQLALAFVAQNPQRKILLVAADIARYELQSTAESSQGAGAVAMLITAHPRLLAIEQPSGVFAEEVMDFWRPLYSEVALVNGKLSCDTYLKMLDETWRKYVALSGRAFAAHQYFCYHTPVPKMVEVAHRRLAKANGYKLISGEMLAEQVGRSLIYSRIIGNIYAASLYLGIISLLDNSSEDLAGQRIGLYSYGSGSTAEYFSAQVMPQYRAMLQISGNQQMLTSRQELSCHEYEKFHDFSLPHDGSLMVLPVYSSGKFRLAKIENHQRHYVKCHI